jgi:4-amino-4-deoxy-L-arabinose transferase-like glycosyltransferase
MPVRLKPHLSTLLLGGIFLTLSISTVGWTLRDRTPPAWDPSDHLRYAYDYYRLLARGDFAGFFNEFFRAQHYYAPFVHLVTAAVFLVFGVSRLTGIFVNLIGLAAMLWAVSSISTRLYRSELAVAGDGAQTPAVSLAVLPALIASCYHFSAWLMHDAFLDFPLTAAVTVSFALLIRAGDFRDRRDSVWFGVAAGIGMLVKQTFAFFFVLPALYVILRILWRRDRQAVLNLTLAAAALILIAAVWYVPHLKDVIAIFRENQRAAVSENEAPVFTFDSNFFYFHALISMQMQLPLAVLFAAGVVYSIARCRRESVLLYLWLASGIAAFALVANKDVRYTVPVLPAAAILSTCWLRGFNGRNQPIRAKSARALKSALVAIIVTWSFASFFNAQWPVPGFGRAIDTPRYRWMVFARNYYGFDHRPLDDDWSVPQVVRTVSGFGQRTSMDSSAIGSRLRPVLGVVVNLPYLNPSSVALYSRLLAGGRAAPPIVDVRWVVEPSMIERLAECDYLLVRTGLDQAEWVAPAERDVERLIRHNPNQFRRVAGFPIPLKDAEAVIFKLER